MKNVRVLIANDNPQTLQLFSNLLSDESCIVGTVTDGNALITAAAALRPHLIITNIDLPAMTRLVAARRLEALVPDIKVIVLANHEEPRMAATALSAGASVLLLKKEASDLCGQIREIIRDLLTSHPDRFMEGDVGHSNGCPSIEKGVAEVGTT